MDLAVATFRGGERKKHNQIGVLQQKDATSTTAATTASPSKPAIKLRFELGDLATA